MTLLATPARNDLTKDQVALSKHSMGYYAFTSVGGKMLEPCDYLSQFQYSATCASARGQAVLVFRHK